MLTSFPLTPERFADAEAVFRDCGNAAKCWCAYWYLPNADYKVGWGEANARWFKGLVETGPPPGFVAYADGEPAAWCSVAPRRNFDRLNRSRPFAPVDETPLKDDAVWSINCFVVAKRFRRQGLMRSLIREAEAHAARQGARIVEAYPVDMAATAARRGSGDLYTGTFNAFLAEGFSEVARRLPTRPIVRKQVG